MLEGLTNSRGISPVIRMRGPQTSTFLALTFCKKNYKKSQQTEKKKQKIRGGLPPAASVIFTFTPALLAFPQKGFGWARSPMWVPGSHSTCPYQGEWKWDTDDGDDEHDDIHSCPRATLNGTHKHGCWNTWRWMSTIKPERMGLGVTYGFV